MRCGRCGKHFDEEMYSGICPGCGHFHNKQTEYDVSQYFSAKFGDDVKTSTAAQAEKQHAKLHKMYDGYNMHKPGQQTKPYQAGAGQSTYQTGKTGVYQQSGMQGKSNPYQQPAAYGNTQRGGGSSYQKTQTAPYGNIYQSSQGGTYRNSQNRQTGTLEKERNIVPVICIVLAIAAIIITVIACNVKKASLKKIYTTVSYDQEFAEAGQVFEINDRLLMVEKAEIVDTSMLEGMPRDDMLIAVTVNILPTKEWTRSSSGDLIYLTDGLVCRECLDSYLIGDILTEKEDGSGGYTVSDNIMQQLYNLQKIDEEEVLTGYNYLDYSTMEGKTGKFYFLMDKGTGIVEISFNQEREEDGVSVLEKRVSVPLFLEEEGR